MWTRRSRALRLCICARRGNDSVTTLTVPKAREQGRERVRGKTKESVQNHLRDEQEAWLDYEWGISRARAAYDLALRGAEGDTSVIEGIADEIYRRSILIVANEYRRAMDAAMAAYDQSPAGDAPAYGVADSPLATGA